MAANNLPADLDVIALLEEKILLAQAARAKPEECITYLKELNALLVQNESYLRDTKSSSALAELRGQLVTLETYIYACLKWVDDYYIQTHPHNMKGYTHDS